MDYKRGRGIGVFNDIFYSRCRFRDNTKCVLERSLYVYIITSISSPLDYRM